MSKYDELVLELESIRKQGAKHWAVQTLSDSQEPHCEGAMIEINLIHRGGSRHLALDGDACKRLSCGLVKLIEREIEWQISRELEIGAAISAANELLEQMDGDK
jgi:hypothetical protein